MIIEQVLFWRTSVQRATGVAEVRALAKHKPQAAPPCTALDGVGQFGAAK